MYYIYLIGSLLVVRDSFIFLYIISNKVGLLQFSKILISKIRLVHFFSRSFFALAPSLMSIPLNTILPKEKWTQDQYMIRNNSLRTRSLFETN